MAETLEESDVVLVQDGCYFRWYAYALIMKDRKMEV